MFEIKFKGLDKLQRAFNIAPELIKKHFTQAMIDVIFPMEKEVKEKTPVFTGTLRSSIGGTVTELGGYGVEGKVAPHVSYAPYMEFGTKPHFPPVSALERWAEIKLGNRNLAFVIARKISKRGLAAREMFKKTFEANLEKIQNRMFEAVAAILQEMAK